LFLQRRDHILKIDLAQKTHDDKWGFLNNLQPQVEFQIMFLDVFLEIAFSFDIGSSIRSETVTTIFTRSCGITIGT